MRRRARRSTQALEGVTVRGRPLLRTVLAFGLLGPLLGAVATLIYVFSRAGYSNLTLYPPELSLVLAVLLWAYALAILPAALAGLVWGIAALRCSGGRPFPLYARWIGGLLIGGALSLGAGVMWDAVGQSRLALLMGCVGAVAGSLLAIFFPSSQELATPSNNALEQARGQQLR